MIREKKTYIIIQQHILSISPLMSVIDIPDMAICHRIIQRMESCVNMIQKRK